MKIGNAMVTVHVHFSAHTLHFSRVFVEKYQNYLTRYRERVQWILTS